VATHADMDEPSDRTRRLANLYLVLSRTNRAIERAADDADLLRAACQTITEVGGFVMSWVGKVQTDTGSVEPVASFGRDDGYLDFVQVRLEGARSEGPTGQAVRQRRTVGCRDIATDPRMEPWREQALRRGYRSSVGLPLFVGEALYGVLTVYADTPDRFDEGEIELLEELARDVSFGLTTIEESTERRRAQTALIESERRFRATAETSLDPFVILSAVRDDAGKIVDFVYEFANEAACVYNHRTRDELIGRRLLEILPSHQASGLVELYAHTVETGEALVLDDLEYEDSWGEEHARRVFDVRASKLDDSIAYTWRDVTERRQAERRRAEELERRVRERTAELELAERRAAELAGLSTALLAITDRREVSQKLLETVARVSGAVDGLVALVLPDSEDLVMLGSTGYDEAELERIARSPASLRTPIRDVAAAGEPLVLENSAAFADRYGALASIVSNLRDRARIAIPLRARDSIIGGVSLGFAPRAFDRAELDFFVSAANAAALALERLRLTAAESEARGMLDSVVAQMPVGVAVAGRDGRILYRNSAFEQVVPSTAARDAGGWVGLHPGGGPYRAQDLPAARSLARGEVVVNEEIEFVRPDGGKAVITQTSAPVHDASGQIIGAVVVSVDVTERKAAEQLRNAFLSVLSHELRTPVTTISAGSQFLAARGERLEPAEREELTRDIADESDRLVRMIDDLLVLARAERGVDLTAHGVTSVEPRLRTVVAALTAQWPNRTFSVDVPRAVPPVVGEDGYLSQVLWNLIGNAAKYGRARVAVRVRVRTREVDVTILDDGPGIPELDRERVFELFTRLDATRGVAGTGIGLFVARRLAQAMGGRLSVGDGPEGGAAFKLTLRRSSGRDEDAAE
jgi:PAS domain S-box-containing protein